MKYPTKSRAQLLEFFKICDIESSTSFSISEQGKFNTPVLFKHNDLDKLRNSIYELTLNRLYIVSIWHIMEHHDFKRDTCFKFELRP